MMQTVPTGTVLHGRYRIERVLGSGGFGHVYLAVDLHTNQQYAIKEYLVTGANGQAQLQHEARVLSTLHHPNMPEFHEAFNERGHYYVVLSYIEGTDLTDLIRITRRQNDVIPVARILAWMLSVCDAVYFLHNQHPPVIHRDIKPDNIRIMPDGTAMLVDLGNAKAAADGSRTLFFIRHQGTPGYAPQEQYPGGVGTDARSDVYALGGTLYFALTSQEPPNVSTRSQAQQQRVADLPTLQEQLANNPSEGSTDGNARQFRLGISKPAKPAPRHIRHIAQLGTLPPELLNQLNTIITRAMAMRPRDRYQSVADFSNDLRRVLVALPRQSVHPPPSGRPVDPNSTQPDLPQLYEAIQAAKASSDQSTIDSPAVPSVSPVSNAPAQSTQATICSRCGATSGANAVFCPRCGSSLKDQQNTLEMPRKSKYTSQQTAHPKLADASSPPATPAKLVKDIPNTPPLQQLQQASAPTSPQSRQVGKQDSKPVQAIIAISTLEQSEPAMNNNAAGYSQPSDTGGISSFRLNPGLIIAIILIVMLLILLALFAFSHFH